MVRGRITDSVISSIISAKPPISELATQVSLSVQLDLKRFALKKTPEDFVYLGMISVCPPAQPPPLQSLVHID